MDHLQTVKNKFNQIADSQEDKGIEKYGQPLNPLDNYDWLGMALEEQVDGTKYLIAEMEKRKFIAEKIRSIAGRNCDYTSYQVINHWLEVLEGKS